MSSKKTPKIVAKQKLQRNVSEERLRSEERNLHIFWQTTTGRYSGVVCELDGSYTWFEMTKRTNENTYEYEEVSPAAGLQQPAATVWVEHGELQG
jgi:hypothetical protein